MLKCVVILSLVSLFHAADKPPWTYNPEDIMSDWSAFHPQCGTRYQSPIHITSDILVVNESMPALEFSPSYYEEVTGPVLVENNGHTVVWHFEDAPVDLQLSKGDLPTNYRLLSFHFHWGQNDSIGSEHVLNGYRYPIELHMVHLAEDPKQVNDTEQLAVLGVLFERSEEDNPWINEIFDNVYGKLLFKGENLTLDRLPPMMNAIPQDSKTFFRYQGSLTTPPCHEWVIWTVFADTIPISHRQLHDFRVLFTSEEGAQQPQSMNNNYRPLQPLNNRTVQVHRIPAIMQRPMFEEPNSRENVGIEICISGAERLIFSLSACLLAGALSLLR